MDTKVLKSPTSFTLVLGSKRGNIDVDVTTLVLLLHILDLESIGMFHDVILSGHI